MKKWIAALISVSMLLSLCACSHASTVLGIRPLATVTYPKSTDRYDYEAQQAVQKQNPVSSDFRKAVSGFSYETACAVLSSEQGNAVYSPISLYYALALAATGASGDTQAQLFALLGASDADVLSTQCANLYRQHYLDNDTTKLKIANSLWMNSGYSFLNPFVKSAAKNFYASSYSVDFEDDATGKAMAQWVADNTNGNLSPTFEPDVNQIFSIISTLCFNDAWSDAFLPEQTVSGMFHAPEGDVSVDFMRKSADLSGYFTGDGFTRSSISLVGGGEMVFILPAEGVSITDLLSSAQRIQALFEGGTAENALVSWKLPKFSYQSEYQLVDTIKALGITRAFEENADFSGIINTEKYELGISHITQQTQIAIDEDGVEAASFTEIGFTTSAMSMADKKVEMVLDRPFLYGIMAQNGTLLLVGVCSNPTAA